MPEGLSCSQDFGYEMGGHGHFKERNSRGEIPLENLVSKLAFCAGMGGCPQRTAWPCWQGWAPVVQPQASRDVPVHFPGVPFPLKVDIPF